jgi:hypothetical protein
MVGSQLLSFRLSWQGQSWINTLAYYAKYGRKKFYNIGRRPVFEQNTEIVEDCKAKFEDNLQKKSEWISRELEKLSLRVQVSYSQHSIFFVAY